MVTTQGPLSLHAPVQPWNNQFADEGVAVTVTCVPWVYLSCSVGQFGDGDLTIPPAPEGISGMLRVKHAGAAGSVGSGVGVGAWGIGVAVGAGGRAVGGVDFVAVGRGVSDSGVTGVGSCRATVGSGVTVGWALPASGSKTAVTTRSPLIVTVLEGAAPSSKSPADQWENR